MWKQHVAISQIGKEGFWTGGEEHWDGRAQPHRCHPGRDLEPGCSEAIYTNNGLLQGVMG